ncbi:hypothetical protein LCGC14_0196030 [marine sediment metagenome]|uniref:Uncharacterized protein n=1 Tax=marine sediment metagenome TaxID=412755 RepID=A0A0F9UKM2_9ZZZZ
MMHSLFFVLYSSLWIYIAERYILEYYLTTESKWMELFILAIGWIIFAIGHSELADASIAEALAD